MKKIDIKKVYEDIDLYKDKKIKFGGWVRSVRDLKKFGFITLFFLKFEITNGAQISAAGAVKHKIKIPNALKNPPFLFIFPPLYFPFCYFCLFF